MKKTLLGMASAAALLTGVYAASASTDPMVGGHAMYDSKNIVENASASSDHTTLVAAVKAAGLVDTLESKGPFTVFAPTNEAFDALPAGTVDTLLKPENKDKLASILKYHVVSGDYDAAKLKDLIKQGDGTASLKTVEGSTLTFMASGSDIQIKDEKGNVATITIPDVKQSNGEVQVINKVLLPG